MKQIIFLTTFLISFIMNSASQNTSQQWNKTFPQSDKVTVEKVSFENRYGITIVADMYLPKTLNKNQKYSAIIIGTPYGGVKEQGAGIYAQTLAERGFVTLAFDESFNGESSGTPRHTSSPEIFVEDFSATVDFIGTRPFVDRTKIGVIGICGAGSFAISAAKVDKRIKAIVTVSMYDISRAISKGFNDMMSEKDRNQLLEQLGEQRWEDFVKGEKKLSPRGAPQTVDENTDPISREFYEYYSTKRGFHPNSITQFTLTSNLAFMNFPLLQDIQSIAPRPILFVIGEHAHSRYFSEDAYKLAAEPKELYIIKGAGHVDLYDKMEYIPFDKLTSFFNQYLK